MDEEYQLEKEEAEEVEDDDEKSYGEEGGARRVGVGGRRRVPG